MKVFLQALSLYFIRAMFVCTSLIYQSWERLHIEIRVVGSKGKISGSHSKFQLASVMARVKFFLFLISGAFAIPTHYYKERDVKLACGYEVGIIVF